MNQKLYFHQTDGGAKYLCLEPITGTDEGDLSTAIVRLDGEPELIKRNSLQEGNAKELIKRNKDELKRILKTPMVEIRNLILDEDCDRTLSIEEVDDLAIEIIKNLLLNNEN